jgi:hypothetical protein
MLRDVVWVVLLFLGPGDSAPMPTGAHEVFLTHERCLKDEKTRREHYRNDPGIIVRCMPFWVKRGK